MQADRPGMVIAQKYQLLELAGEGGMGKVWRAMVRGAEGFLRPVAVKRILSNFGHNNEFVQMFIEEARVGTQLIHPNIVQIHDFGKDEHGNYYLVMEWVEGIDLRRYALSFKALNQLPPWHLITAITIEVLRALSSAHTRHDDQGNPAPVYHRDVSPPNIIIGVNGIVKLSDFGLSRAMDRARMTRPDIVKGKAGYIAPELTRGAQATPQSDIYGVGVVMWESLTGRQLFTGKNEVEVMLAARKGDIPSIASLRPDLPPKLVEAIHRALALESVDRFSAARVMIRDLANILRGYPYATDAEVIAESVIAACRRIGIAPSGVPAESPLQLTRRKEPSSS